MEYRLLLLGFCLIISALLMNSEKSSVVLHKIYAKRSDSNNLSNSKINIVKHEFVEGYSSVVHPKLTNSNTESNGTHLNTNTKASLEARNSREFDNINSDPIIPYSEEAILSKKINELIAMQTEENKEEIEMKLEDLIYKYSTNEQREQYDRDLDQIDNQIYSIN